MYSLINSLKSVHDVQQQCRLKQAMIVRKRSLVTGCCHVVVVLIRTTYTSERPISKQNEPLIKDDGCCVSCKDNERHIDLESNDNKT